MNTLEKVRAKIIEAVPEIVCEVPIPFKNAKGNWQYPYTDSTGKNQHSPEFGMGESALSHALTSGFFESRPITLADVLIAIEKFGSTGYSYRVDIEGWLHIEGEMGQRFWNLSSSLDEQEPEVHEFLYKILDV